VLRIRSGSGASSVLPGIALLVVVAVGPSGCGASAPRRPAFTPAEEARHRVKVLRENGRILTPEQVATIERLPFRSSGPTDIPRALREGLPEPSVPLGERRSLLEQFRGDEAGGVPSGPAPRTGEEPSVDPQR
jgi:hypothetical protein